MSSKRCTIMLAAAVALAAVAAGDPQPATAGDTVQKAYELRMKGEAGEARTLLEQAIAYDPANAAAHFELSRTLLHMGLGKPGDMEGTLDKAQDSIMKAVELDPENPQYRLFAGNIAFMQAYMSLHDDMPDAREKMGKVCSVYESALETKPDCLEPMLYLVELYGVIPEEKGGDKSKAEKIAEVLEEKNPVYGAKARSLLLPEDADRIEYWQGVLESHLGDPDVLEELGKSCLYGEKEEDGIGYLEKAIAADPKRTDLILDIARYHLMLVMKGMGSKEKAWAAAEKAAKRYLETEPVPPLKAYAIAILARVKFGMEDREGADELKKKAEAIDPYYSKAFGMPSRELFIPPGEVSHNHRYLFRPI